MDIAVGDTLKMKKPHPCGGDTFLVLRTGMDLKLRCEKCGREFMGARQKLERGIKKITPKNTSES